MQKQLNKLSDKWVNADAGAAADMSNAINTIIDKVFEDYMLLGYELLQNADDANAAHVSYHLLQDYLVVSHDGATFSEDDVERLCSFGPRSVASNTKRKKSNKAYDVKKIGYKGIGFKSVFQIAQQVWVFSKKEYQFRFDKTEWGLEQLPWQLMPIESTKEDLPESIQNLVQEQHVTFVLRLKSAVSRAQKSNGLDSGKSSLDFKLAKLFRKEHLLLFLRNVDGVSFYWQAPQTLTWVLERELLRKRKGDIYEIQAFQGPASHWIIKSFTLKVPSDVHEAMQQMDERYCPPKLKEATEIELSLAARFGSKGELVAQLEASLFTYLPTEAQFKNIPFYVNSNFLLNSERTELLAKNEWNWFLFESVGYHQFEWFAALSKDERFRFSFTDLIAKYADSSTDYYHTAVNVGVERATRAVSFVPVLDSDELKKIPETVVEKTGILASIPQGKTMVVDYFSDKKEKVFIADPQLKTIDNLVRIGARKFDREELAEAVRRYAYFSKPDTNGALLRFLYEKTGALRGLEKTNWYNALLDTPFVLTEESALRQANQVFLPTKEANLPLETKVEFIHDDVFSQHILPTAGMAAWLEELGTAYPNSDQLIKKILVPLLEQDEVPLEKLVECTQFVFKHWKQLDEETLDRLQAKMPYFNTENKVRIGPGSFLSNAYQPQLALEAAIGKGQVDDEPLSFTSPIYIEVEEEQLEWKRFFKRLGHREDFDLSFYEGSFSFAEVQEEYPDYCAWFVKKGIVFPKNNKAFFDTFLLPRYFYLTEQHDVALKYWEVILYEKYDLLRTYANKAKFKIENTVTSIPSYFHFLIETKSCFPAKDGKCYPIHLVHSQALEAMVGSLKPIAALELSPAKEEFLGIKQDLNLNECLDLLAELAAQENKAYKDQIFAIYQYILSKNYKFEAEDNKYVPVLTTNGSFESLADVQYFNVAKYAKNTKSKHFIRLDFSEKNALKFCKKMQISVVIEQDLKMEETGKMESSFGTHAMNRLPYLSALLASKPGLSPLDMQEEVGRVLQAVHFWETKTLMLHYQSAENTLIFEKKISVWKEQNDVYYTGDWKNRATMYALAAFLAKELNQEVIAHEIDTLLSLENEDALRTWLMDLDIDLC